MPVLTALAGMVSHVSAAFASSGRERGRGPHVYKCASFRGGKLTRACNEVPVCLLLVCQVRGLENSASVFEACSANDNVMLPPGLVMFSRLVFSLDCLSLAVSQCRRYYKAPSKAARPKGGEVRRERGEFLCKRHEAEEHKAVLGTSRSDARHESFRS